MFPLRRVAPVHHAIVDAFTGGSKPKVEPIPTRDTAADAVDEERKRIGDGRYGAGTLMLSGTGGVTKELTGVRGAGGG